MIFSVDKNRFLDMFDEDGNEYKSVLSEEAGEEAMRVIVKTCEAVKALHDLAEYTEYHDFEQIKCVGEWI